MKYYTEIGMYSGELMLVAKDPEWRIGMQFFKLMGTKFIFSQFSAN